MRKSVDIGKDGETAAVAYIKNKGYKILKQNYHSRFGEIDIVAEKENFIVFIEVKTRQVNTKFIAFEAVDTFKQKKIIKTAMIYLSENNITLQPRFDVIAVLFKENSGRIEEINHIKNAFDGVDFFETF